MNFCGIALPRAQKRLLTIFEEAQALASEKDVIADVGTDHGYLPVMLAKTGKYKKIIASDISAPSLQKAIALAQRYEQKIDFVVCDGLDDIHDATIVCMCGIGGNEIIDILKKSSYRGKMVLQPTPTDKDLRDFLIDNNYHIAKDYVIEDNGKFYFIFVVDGKNIKNKYTKKERLFGKTNLKNRSPDFISFLKTQIKKLKFLENFDITGLSRKSVEEIELKKEYLNICKEIVGKEIL